MDTIKSSADISNLFDCGKRLHTPYLTLIVRHNAQIQASQEALQHDHCGRVAFIAGKKNGNAVWRNKAKRRMRSICSDLGGPWANYDVAFLAKASLTKCTYDKVLHTCNEALKKFFSHDES